MHMGLLNSETSTGHKKATLIVNREIRICVHESCIRVTWMLSWTQALHVKRKLFRARERPSKPKRICRAYYAWKLRARKAENTDTYPNIVLVFETIFKITQRFLKWSEEARVQLIRNFPETPAELSLSLIRPCLINNTSTPQASIMSKTNIRNIKTCKMSTTPSLSVSDHILYVRVICMCPGRTPELYTLIFRKLSTSSPA